MSFQKFLTGLSQTPNSPRGMFLPVFALFHSNTELEVEVIFVFLTLGHYFFIIVEEMKSDEGHVIMRCT